MISEQDIADWDFEQIKREARKETYNDEYLFEFLTEMEQLQKRGKKQIAALFKPPKEADV